MKFALKSRGASWIVLAGWVGLSGCTHNHYYTGVPVSSQVGQICEVPNGPVTISGAPVVTPGTSSSVVVPRSRPSQSVVTNGQPRVVISQPTYGPSIGQSVSRFKWRAPDPETLTTTRAEGFLDDETTRR